MPSVKMIDDSTIQVVVCYGYKTNRTEETQKTNF